MSRHIESRLARLEQVRESGRRLPVILVRPDDQTDEERKAFDADLQRRKARGDNVILIGPDDDPLDALLDLLV